jgi:hypothetical protein
MTDTATRPLPTDWATMKAYLPAEPTDTTVTQARAAIARIDQLITTTRADLDDLEHHDRTLVAELVDTAIHAPGPLEPIAQRLDPGNRAVLEHRLEQLNLARSTVVHRLTTAERTDPAQLAWRQQCEQVTREWQFCQNVETPSARFEALTRFAERH